MPRPKRAKVAPSAPTAIPFLERIKAKALASQSTFNPESDHDNDHEAPTRTRRGRNVEKASKQNANRKAALLTGNQAQIATAGDGTTENSEAIGKRREFDDLYDVSDKENEQPTRTMAQTNKSKATVQNTPSSVSNYGRGLDSQLSKQNSRIRRNPQTTPFADSSIFSLADFKRRPRQPSILGIGQADDTPSLSSLGDLSVDLEDDLDDFRPQDESTPLNTKRRSQQVLQSSASQGLQNARTGRTASQGTSRKRKFTPENVQVAGSQTLNHDDDHDLSSPSINRFDTEATDDEPTLPTPKTLAPGALVEVWDEVMALPESNSSSQDTACSISENGTISQPPAALQSRTTRVRHQDRKTSTSLSTASLQNLLPRRHQQSIQSHSADGLDLDLSSSGDNEQDELSFAPGRQRNGKNPARVQTRGKSKRLGSKTAPAPTANAKTQPAASDSHDASIARHTYGRRSNISEDVNDSLVTADDDATFVPNEDSAETTETLDLPKEAKVEMRKISQKFQEVDQWEMDFEDVSGRSSSPGYAR